MSWIDDGLEHFGDGIVDRNKWPAILFIPMRVPIFLLLFLGAAVGHLYHGIMKIRGT